MTSDIYYPDDVPFPPNSPLMKPLVLKLEPSPSPPAIPHIVDPTRGDGVLIQHLDGGRRPEISQEAAYRPLDQTSEDGCNESETICDESDDDDKARTDNTSIPISHFQKNEVEPVILGSISRPDGFLRSLAEGALAAARAVSGTVDADDLRSPNRETQGSRRISLVENLANGGGETPILNAKRPVLALPISQYPPIHRSPEMYSPRQRTPSQVLMAPNSLRSPASLTPGNDELAPIQMASPRSELSTHDPLPSIRSQVPELHTSPKGLAVRPSPQYCHSPPSGPSPLGGMAGNHASPPISPNDRYRNSIPSPAKTLPALSPFPQINSHNSHQSPPNLDYNGSGSKLDRPSISQVLTPPTDGIANRMSITNVTNPPVGQFVCKFKGCNAPAFQTQYLLNSHANVHSTNRPHYCPVKGCSRGEGGQGFKRKNEMIRHGLVHDSPGYVCPFCPEREHKYPRPDNLQRHVRVHHMDKDKEDPALREVLAHRPDGPNRGRRRRGVP